MSSEDNFDDKPLADVDEKALAKALDSEHVFERSSAPPSVVAVSSPSSTDEFPDEPEPETEPFPEAQSLDAEFVDPASDETALASATLSGQQSSYGHLDPASLAAAGSGELQDPDLAVQAPRTVPAAALSVVASHAQAPHTSTTKPTPSGTGLAEGMVLQPHLAHLTQVGLVNSDTWDEQIKPRIEHLQEQITEVNDRLDHLTTRKYR